VSFIFIYNVYWTLAMGWTAEESGFNSQQGQEISFSLFLSIQGFCGAHSASYPMGTERYLPLV
jgi:hypothetical protein